MTEHDSIAEERIKDEIHQMRDALRRFFADSHDTEHPEAPGFVYVSPTTQKAMRRAIRDAPSDP